jgi:PPOX class probable F420-dependent enzyme
VSTVDPDGRPHVTVVWIGLDGDDVVSGHMHRNRKVRNVERDPRVVLSFDAPRTPGLFLAEHAVLHTRASVEPTGGRALLARLAKVYVAPEFEFPAPPDADGYVIRYTIERISGVGPWAG